MPEATKMAAGAQQVTTPDEAASGSKSKLARRLISLEELAKHNTEEDCWVAIHGLVIDVNKELKNEHPGGPEVILALAGKDVTEDFEDIGHSDTAREWTDRLVIGHLDAADAEKAVPRNAELSGGKGGASIGIAPLILAFLVVIAAYLFYFY